MVSDMIVISMTTTGALVWSAVCMGAGALITLRIQKVRKRT